MNRFNYNCETRYLFVAGSPIKHSLSPLIQNEMIKRFHINAAYLPLDVDANGYGGLLNILQIKNCVGCNLTLPLKELAKDFEIQIDPDAKEIGSVNILHKKGNEIWGANTDYLGFELDLREQCNLDLNGNTVFVVGAGGAARAILYSLVRMGVGKIYLLNRTLSHAQALGEWVKGVSPKKTKVELVDWKSELFEELGRVSLFVNTLPLYVKKVPFFAAPEFHDKIRSSTQKIIFYDLNYVSSPMGFVSDSVRNERDSQFIFVDGLGMLIQQGILSFEKWFGKKVSFSMLKKKVESWKKSQTV